MRLKIYEHRWEARRSYLIADQASRQAAVIDPQGDVEVYLTDAWRMGVRIRHVFFTQRDESFGGATRAEMLGTGGATVYAGAWTRPNGTFLPLKDGDVIEFGRIRIRILEIPGHALEGLALLLYDLAEGERLPRLAFTGGTILDGSVGRPVPHFEGGYSSTDLAGMLHESLRRFLEEVHESTRICPSHPAETIAPGRSSPLLRRHLRHNHDLWPQERSAFVRSIAGGMVDRFAPASSTRPAIQFLSLPQVLRLKEKGVQVVDVRDPDDFSVAHVAGSLNVGLASAFEGWAAALVDCSEPVVLVAAPGSEAEALDRLRRSGLTRIEGVLAGGISTLESRPVLARRAERWTVTALARRRGSLTILDVSDDPDISPGLESLSIPLEDLTARLRSVPRGRVAVLAGDVYRSSAAASLLRARGVPGVVEVAGGRAAWELCRALGRCPRKAAGGVQ